MELLSVAQRKMERIMLDITLRDHQRNTGYDIRQVQMTSLTAFTGTF